MGIITYFYAACLESQNNGSVATHSLFKMLPWYTSHIKEFVEYFYNIRYHCSQNSAEAQH